MQGGNAAVIKINKNGVKLWSSTFEDVFYYAPYSASVNSVFEVSDGYIFAGNGNPSESSTMSGACGILLKTNYSGTKSWSRNYSDFKIIRKALPTIDGGYILAGDTYTKGPGGCDMYLVKTNSSGDITWTKVFGTATADESCLSMEATKDGGFLLLGSNGLIVKTDENGDVE
ncbi:MAG TPA: hypothetical protein VHP36_00985 [Chitinispirillaceae bacterium]|nr:hypothetical protein [Chitinispirillaceae bacterium]